MRATEDERVWHCDNGDLTIEPQRWREVINILEMLEGKTINEMRDPEEDGIRDVAILQRLKDKLHLIDETIQQINEGEYGVCKECDEDIPLGRLKALQFTRYCVKCMSDLEKQEAQAKQAGVELVCREIPIGDIEDD